MVLSSCGGAFLFAEARDVQQHLTNRFGQPNGIAGFYSLKRETFSSTRMPSWHQNGVPSFYSLKRETFSSTSARLRSRVGITWFLFAEARDVQQHSGDLMLPSAVQRFYSLKRETFSSTGRCPPWPEPPSFYSLKRETFSSTSSSRSSCTCSPGWFLFAEARDVQQHESTKPAPCRSIQVSIR